LVLTSTDRLPDLKVMLSAFFVVEVVGAVGAPSGKSSNSGPRSTPP